MGNRDGYYLLVGLGGGEYWPMDTVPTTRKEVEEAKRWQLQGGFGAQLKVCYYSPHRKVFIQHGTGMNIALGSVKRGPYTEAAFERFLSLLPKVKEAA